jgi:hypothetical protein
MNLTCESGTSVRGVTTFGIACILVHQTGARFTLIRIRMSRVLIYGIWSSRFDYNTAYNFKVFFRLYSSMCV